MPWADGDNLSPVNLNFRGIAGPVFNVLDPAYSAVSTLAADSTASIQAAIDAAHANGGGIVYIPKGAYAVTTLRYHPGTRIVGDGGGNAFALTPATQLYQASAATCLLRPNSAASSNEGIVLEDFILSASGNDNNLGGIDLVAGINSRLNRIGLSGFSGFGLRIRNGNADGDSMYVAVNDCSIHNMNTAGSAIVLQSNATGHPDGVAFHDLVVNSNGTWIECDNQGQTGPDSVSFVQCRFVASSAVSASNLSGAVNWQFVVNRFETTAGQMSMALRPQTGSQPAAFFVCNTYAAPGGLVWTDSATTPSPRFYDIVPGPTIETRLPHIKNSDRTTLHVSGRIYYNSDDANLNIDDGTNWILPNGTTT